MKEENELQELKQQVLGLGALVQLENKCRQTENIKEFGFHVTNETRQLLNYHQAVFFLKQGRNFSLYTISGVPNPETNAPYIKWLKKLQGKVLRKSKERSVQRFKKEQLPKSLQKGWQEWTATHGAWCPFEVNGKILGGIWFTRDDEWQDVEIGLMNQIGKCYAYTLHALQTKPRWWNPRLNLHYGKTLFKVAVTLLSIAALFLPVRLSVLAPARITAQTPLVVTSPLHGVIKELYVQPNQQVKKGQILFSLDDTELRNRHNVAQKALEVVQEEYKRSRQKSLLKSDKGTDVDLLAAKVTGKRAEVAFAAEELSLVKVKAARDGIALFGRANDLIGKPVVTGEKIITLADPNLKDLEIHVPIENAISLTPGTEVQMFLNIDPTINIDARITQTSYEAEVTEEQILAYIVRATLNSDNPELRIGLRGTAKIFGKTTPLYYYLFRRPMAKLRRTFGL